MVEDSQEVFEGLRDASYDIDEQYYLLNVPDLPPPDLDLNIEMFPYKPLDSSPPVPPLLPPLVPPFVPPLVPPPVPTPLPKNEEEDIKKPKKKRNRKNSKQSEPSSSPQIDATWEDYNWQCQYCDSHFSTVAELKSHGIEMHDCCNPYKCTNCNIRKSKLDCFVTHVTTHYKGLKFSCCICYEKFPEINQAKIHYKTHFIARYACSGCNESFETFDELDQHNLSYKRDTQAKQMSRANLNENLRCHVCKKTFKHKRTLASHILKHTTSKQEHKCERCGKTYVTKQGLKGHLMVHDNIRPFSCLICNYKFRTFAQLRIHVGVHNEAKPYECAVCGKCFRLEKQLLNHQIIHTDKYPYTCGYCEKNFRFKSFVREHIRQHTGVKPYCCDVCDKKFASWANYNKHMKTLHDIDVAKRRWTTKGICPIDPKTGKAVVWQETQLTNEWKHELLYGPRKPGRPKTRNIQK